MCKIRFSIHSKQITITEQISFVTFTVTQLWIIVYFLCAAVFCQMKYVRMQETHCRIPAGTTSSASFEDVSRFIHFLRHIYTTPRLISCRRKNSYLRYTAMTGMERLSHAQMHCFARFMQNNYYSSLPSMRESENSLLSPSEILFQE